MTLALRVLGPLEFRAPDGTECRRVLQQPKRLGLLIYLALHVPRGLHRRDSLVALFWPDLDTARARAALRRALHFLRRELGDGVVVNRGEEEVGIGEGVLATDVEAFDRALACGDHARAMALYRGHLLEGYFVAGAPDVVDWLDRERSRLRECSLRAAWTLVEQSEATPSAALAWARRAVQLSPDDESNVSRYLALLVKLGERSQAVQAYRELERRLESHFGVAPSPATRAIVEPIGSAPVPSPSPSASGDLESLAEDARRVLVAPFSVRGADGLQYLGEGVMELLSGALADAGEFHAVDAGAVFAELQRRPHAEAAALATFFRAPRYIDGTVVGAGGRLRLLATLRATATRDVLARGEGEVHGEADVFRLVDDVLRQLLTSLPSDPGTRLTRVAARTVASVAALKAFLRAERDFRLGRLFEAIGGFDEAARLDPDFGVAHFRLASALAAAAQLEAARAANARALAVRDRVSEREWAHFRAQEAWLAGDTAEADLRYDALLAQWPEDFEARYLLADLRLHTNPDRGRSIAEAKPALKQALALDPGHVGARVKLARIEALAGRTARAAEHAARAVELSPDSDQALAVRALMAWRTDDPLAQHAVLSALETARAQTLMIAFADVAVYGGDLVRAERFGAALTDRIHSDDLRAVAWLVRGYVALARGRIADGLAMLREQGTRRPGWSRELAALAVAGSAFPPEAVPLAAMRDEVAAWADVREPPTGLPLLMLHDGLHAHLRRYLLGKLDARMGRIQDAVAAAEALAEEPVSGEAGGLVPQLLRDLTASAHEAAARHDEGLRIRRSPAPTVWYQLAIGSPFFTGAEQRFRHAQALETGGRDHEAMGWYASIAERSPWELPWKAPAMLRLGRLHERAGRSAPAAACFREVIALWRDADDVLQPVIADLNRRLAEGTA